MGLASWHLQPILQAQAGCLSFFICRGWGAWGWGGGRGKGGEGDDAKTIAQAAQSAATDSRYPEFKVFRFRV